MARDEHGPDFDDRLIKLVRANSAIYDVSHPHYRRTPVRMAIWDNIAQELGAPSRFLQTKWKNIRYNYLQEQKCLETGTINTNIRKRRFTEDLSFLKYTAYRKDAPTKTSFNGSDNDSNSFMYPDNLSAAVSSSYEVIELDQSDDEEGHHDYMPDVSAFLAPMNDTTEDNQEDPYAQPDNVENDTRTTATSTNGTLKKNERTQIPQSPKDGKSGSNSPDSHRSSPLLTPISASIAKHNGGTDKTNWYNNKVTNGSSTKLSEITIQPLSAPTSSSPLMKKRPFAVPPEEIMTNAAKRKAAPTLQPINDPIELYCLSLVDCLRAMSRSERERVKFEFSKILKDAEYVDQS
ncbi:dorsal interacting protein 3 isoform X2 [Haematobia irritans]|uniref:dorsal interacting protein 3 isoform X2 n=1 Tax=Haematobia irritans TaxID=7368 RepID=UPI003F503D7F